jgi:hypothetical protein
VAGGELHLLVIVARAHVERAAEDAREREHVVDLVRVVRAARRDHRRRALDLLRLTSGVGFAIAKTIASVAIARDASTLTAPGTERPMKTSAPASASSALPRKPRVRVLGVARASLVRPGRPR